MAWHSISLYCIGFMFFWRYFADCSCELKFAEFCEKYAKPEDIGAGQEEKSSDEELSEDEYASSDDEGVAGQADP